MSDSTLRAEAASLTVGRASARGGSREGIRRGRPRAFMMDLWSIVPYYDAYLCQALQSQPVAVELGAITYYLDPSCFSVRGVRNRPGALDIAGRFKFPRGIRQALKLLENGVNTASLMLRFLFSPRDIVHVQYLPLLQRRLPFEFWFLRYCRRLGSRLVCTVHDILPSDTGEKYARTFQRLYGMMDALICHSETVKEELIARFQIDPDRIRVIPHGPFFFDFPRLPASEARGRLGIGGHECLVLWQGIIRPYKGVEFLLDAWARVERAGANARLLIAGTGDAALLDAIRRKVEALSLRSVELRFAFAASDEMLAYYQAADVVVYPYKAVTTSGALMTGVTQGRAIIATSLAPFRELLRHRENALLCDYGNTDDLASAILQLTDNPGLRSELAAAAGQLNPGAEMWKQIAERTAACYESVLP